MKIFKVLFIIISCSIVFILTDFLYFNIYASQQKNDTKLYLKEYIQCFNLYSVDDSYRYFREMYQDRDYIDLNSKKRPVLIMGGSFGYGFELENEQTFQYKLGKLTHRSVYNRAIPSFGLQNSIYMLQNYNFEKEIKNPEYIIYVFIDNHIFRLYRRVHEVTEPILSVNYNLKNGKLVEEKKCKFIYRFAICRRISSLRAICASQLSKDKSFDYLKLHFLKLKEVAKQKYPNTKLVILVYEENLEDWSSKTNRWKELEKEGFIVLNSYDLTNLNLSVKKYRLTFDKNHPNELAWNILTPKIAEKLKL